MNTTPKTPGSLCTVQSPLPTTYNSFIQRSNDFSLEGRQFHPDDLQNKPFIVTSLVPYAHPDGRNNLAVCYIITPDSISWDYFDINEEVVLK